MSNSTVWNFVERFYPNYHRSDEIVHNGDLYKIVNDKTEVGDPSYRLRRPALVMKEDERQLAISNASIYEKSIEGFLENEEYVMGQFKRMEQLFAEKRSDVTEILGHIINGEEWDADIVEHRYILARLPDGREVVYDTLTTLMSLIGDDGEYHELTGHAYYDDRAELDVDTDPKFFEGDPPCDETSINLVRELREAQALIRTTGTAHTFDGSDFGTVLEVASDKIERVMEQLKYANKTNS